MQIEIGDIQKTGISRGFESSDNHECQTARPLVSC